MINYTSGKKESLGYHSGQFVASVGKLCQRGAVGYWDGEGEKNGVAVILPSFLAGIVRDPSTEEFTVPDGK